MDIRQFPIPIGASQRVNLQMPFEPLRSFQPFVVRRFLLGRVALEEGVPCKNFVGRRAFSELLEMVGENREVLAAKFGICHDLIDVGEASKTLVSTHSLLSNTHKPVE